MDKPVRRRFRFGSKSGDVPAPGSADPGSPTPSERSPSQAEKLAPYSLGGRSDGAEHEPDDTATDPVGPASGYVEPEQEHDRQPVHSQGPGGAPLAEVGEQVTAVLTTAQAAADEIRASAQADAARVRAEAEAKAAAAVDEARRAAERARSETEEVRAAAASYKDETTAAADALAREKRRQAEEEASAKLAEAEERARMIREEAHRSAKQVEEEALRRQGTLVEDAKRFQGQLHDLLAVLRDMTTQLERVVGTRQTAAEPEADAERSAPVEQVRARGARSKTSSNAPQREAREPTTR